MKNIIVILFMVSSTFIYSQKNSNINSRFSPVFGIQFLVEADYVGVVSQGCITVNVRVYMYDSNGTKILIANQNVNVGEGCPQRNNIDDSFVCKTIDFKGDIILGSNNNYRYCLVQLFEDNLIYDSYLELRKGLFKK